MDSRSLEPYSLQIIIRGPPCRSATDVPRDALCTAPRMCAVVLPGGAQF